MSKTSAFAFTNTSDAATSVTPKALGLTTNYAISEETANQAVLNNKTAPIDAQEIVSYRTLRIKEVNNNLNIQYPAPVKSGIQYGVQLEETLVTTDTTDSAFRVDEPIVLTLNVRHPRSGNITNDIVGSAMIRLISTLLRSDGTWRFDDLMRSAERPVAD